MHSIRYVWHPEPVQTSKTLAMLRLFCADPAFNDSAKLQSEMCRPIDVLHLDELYSLIEVQVETPEGIQLYLGNKPATGANWGRALCK